MELASIIKRYGETALDRLTSKKDPLSSERKWAMKSIVSCRTPALGEIKVVCSDCGLVSWFSHSCGHRLCSKCQHHANSRWLQRQRVKLLPVSYFLVTFTLPAELRPIARAFPILAFNLLFLAAAETLKEAASNPRFLGGLIGFTGVLHTHSRKLDFHPHVHFIIPGIAFIKEKGLCVRSRDRFIIPEAVLGQLFRGKFLSGLKNALLKFPTSLYRKDWVVDAKFSGMGESALKYLSRYLYRGVISERNIVSDHDGKVTFEYVESKTKERKIRTETGERFVGLVLQHALPKGFRRVRDYGFLHGNARRTMIALQLLLKPKIRETSQPARPAFPCPACGKPTTILAVAVFRTLLCTRNRSPPAYSISDDLAKTA